MTVHGFVELVTNHVRRLYDLAFSSQPVRGQVRTDATGLPRTDHLCRGRLSPTASLDMGEQHHDRYERRENNVMVSFAKRVVESGRTSDVKRIVDHEGIDEALARSTACLRTASFTCFIWATATTLFQPILSCALPKLLISRLCYTATSIF